MYVCVKHIHTQVQVFEDMVKLEYFKYTKNLLIVPLWILTLQSREHLKSTLKPQIYFMELASLSPMCISGLASDSAVASQWGPPSLLDIWFLCSATYLTPASSRAQGHS